MENKKTGIKLMKKKLAELQLKLKDTGIPVVILVEGWGAAGKGSLIRQLLSELDPRFYSFFSLDSSEIIADRYPFMFPFYASLPENGTLLLMDSGYMEAAVDDSLNKGMDELKKKEASAMRFERQLRDNGYIIIKFFLDIKKKEQKKRFDVLERNNDEAWRVSEKDLRQNKEYELYELMYNHFMDNTGKIFPWHIIDAEKRKNTDFEALEIIIGTIEKACKAGKYTGKPFKMKVPLIEMPKLSEVDLSVDIDDAQYRAELKTLQKSISELHYRLYKKKIPLIACFEGWDAAGKGGAIRRFTFPLDPRGFDAYPIASPTAPEKNRHYLWRFWEKLPKTGHIAVFDRTWYGRVLVERIEGFCQENDWKRAYNEINEFERELTDWGAVVLKFWVHIDSETQLERFTLRQNTPEKQWKITDEDWRNREKWPQYEVAVDEMLAKTSTEYAPWHIIESNSKKYARIKTLRIIEAEMRKALGD